MANRRTAALITGVVVMAALAGCAAGTNPAARTGADAAGFWWGLWHGVIAPVTFVVSLFDHDVSIYEVQNNGGWYDLGFLLGLSCVFGGGGRAGGVPRSRRRRVGADA